MRQRDTDRVSVVVRYRDRVSVVVRYRDIVYIETWSECCYLT